MSVSAARAAIFPFLSISAIVYGATRTYTGYKSQYQPSLFGTTAVATGVFHTLIRMDKLPVAWTRTMSSRMTAWGVILTASTLLQSTNIYLCCRVGDEIGKAAKNRELL
jgi:hypothetical protein